MIFTIIGVFIGIAVLALVVWFVWNRRQRDLKMDYFQIQWLELQSHLRDKTKWSKAVTDADTLLDSALKKKHVRGHNMGERLVKAQRMFTDNDGVWFGHKLRVRIEAHPKTKLKESEVKQALLGIRQALKDVGALPDAKPRDKK